jgi:predicted Zn-dependent protease
VRLSDRLNEGETVRCAVSIPAGAVLLAGLSWPAAQETRGFVFTPADEEMLAEVEALDRQFERRGLVFKDPALEVYLERLAAPVIALAGTPERVRWRFRVLKDPSVNAFALPNGSVYLHTGLLALLENESQVAGVLAHEIIHVTKRHTYLHYRSYRKKAFVRHMVVAASQAAPMVPVGGSFGVVLSVFEQVGQRLSSTPLFGFSVDHEREADRLAIDLVAEAGFDPAEIPKTFKLLGETLDPEPMRTFYRDPERLAQRLEQTAKLVADKPASDSPAPGSGYLEIASKAIQYNIQADIDSRRFRTALARAQRMAEFRPEDQENRFLFAEAWRALDVRTPAPTARELTREGQSEARNRLRRKTAEEEEKELLSRPEGQANRRANFEKAEELYRSYMSNRAAQAKVHRSLGMLYEEQGRTEQAREAYRSFLELAPESADALRVQRRLEALERMALKPRPPAKGKP